jgi:serine/threonine-protein kinase
MTAESLPVDKLIGQVLANRYEILQRLGEGAMGAVYKARHVKVGRMFAVKVLHARLLSDPKVAQRFEREAELAGRLRHANVVGVVDVGELDDMHYMVMDYAEGPDLASLLVEAPMPPGRIIRLARQMLEGLYHAHEQGLIHRDFKPENVIIERDTHGNEMPRIVDFGIALLREGGDSTDSAGRLTTNGLVLGTPHYMAPEQAVADPIDHRIDLFALGIVVYEMLSGRLPFDGTGAEVARANLLLDPPPISTRVPYLEVDPLLEAFARRLMEKRRERRPATALAARVLLDLIERDRRAAGVELGVPPELSERAPAMTQPVQRQPRIPTPEPSTVQLRVTPSPSSAADVAVARWLAPIQSEPAEPVPAPERAARASDSLPGATAVPVWQQPGPPVVYAPPSGGQPELDRETAMRTPLDWAAAPPPRRRLVWIATGAVGGLAAVVVAWLALRAPAAHERVAAGPTTTAPAPSTTAVAPAPTPSPAPAVTPAPAPTATAPTVTPAPTASDPAAPPTVTPGPTATDPAAPATSPPVVAEPAVVAASEPVVAGEPAKPVPRKPARPATPRLVDKRPAAPPVADPPLAKPDEPAARKPDPVVETRPVHADPKVVKPPADKPCDLSVPPVDGITPAAIQQLYSQQVAGAISALPKDKQGDLWPRLTRYNVNDLMAAPQAKRDDAARVLWRLLKEATCRK